MEVKGGYGYLVRSMIVAVDFICINLVFLSVCLLYDEKVGEEFNQKIIWLLLNFSYIPILFLFSKIHNIRILYIDHLLLIASEAVLVHFLIFMACLTFLQIDIVPESALWVFYALFFMVLNIWWFFSRIILKIFRRKGYNFKRVVIVGAGKTGLMLYNEMQSDMGYGYRVMGFFDDNLAVKEMMSLYRGTTQDVENFVLNNRIDEIFCALPGSQDAKILQLLQFSEQNAISFYIVPEISRYVIRRMNYQIMGRVPVLSVRQEPLQNFFYRGFKRLFDILFSIFFLVISPIFFIPIAIAVKLSSPGPVFFKQKRTGVRGREFWCYKFRTMRMNKNCDLLQATKDDPRKTRVGEILRKTNLDELPQFINVLIGDMSIVGPRPHMLKHTEDYSQIIDKYMVRHLIKPGLTGWAQVNGFRGETKELWQMEKRVEYDVWYIENWHFWLDIKIIILTIVNIFKGDKNAF